MLVFLDESGNTGIKPSDGTSRYFVIGLVIFLEKNIAQKCDERIDQLRIKLHKPHDFEFHFADNSDKVRKAFINTIKDFNFQYIAVGINKYSGKLPSELQKGKAALYNYICGVALSSSMPYLNSATIIIDKSGSKAFQTNLRNYLRNKLNDKDAKKVKKYKSEDSRKNNLLQLADYCVGILARKMNSKKNWKDYYRVIASKELDFIELLK
ncbi:MAG: DUF3800 domain-containing protein [Candidatus Nomurabacteria bacterium]|jgi:hypothetical protein|nr:DUF3800 domain-containing protein [Candidatus Nomurabacteria bacterium]